MKRFMLSFSVILLFVIYSFQQREESSSLQALTPISQPTTPTPTAIPTPLPASVGSNLPVFPSATPVPSTPTPSQASSQYRDGQYTGDVVDAYYGNVQVKVTIQGGKIADVVFLDYPHDRRTSMMINNQAMPFLKQEAIQAQSSQVDVVSGATATSGGFVTSLESALAKARA